LASPKPPADPERGLYVPRAIVTDGQNGLMVPVGNVEALAAAMQRLIADKNLAQKIAQNGFETYQKHYSQQAVTKSYLELYQNLLHSRKNLQSAA
jgi:glycosyltransferase involved in cell wall biosynthesis